MIDIIRELQDYGIAPLVADPLVDPWEAYEEYGIELSDMSSMRDLNVVVLAVPHRRFANLSLPEVEAMFRPGETKLMVDVKGAFSKSGLEESGIHYWSL
ncbi:UDP-glucose/GDP-mannose dehydrogenase family, UDP binding domain [compost metagenome]